MVRVVWAKPCRFYRLKGAITKLGGRRFNECARADQKGFIGKRSGKRQTSEVCADFGSLQGNLALTI